MLNDMMYNRNLKFRVEKRQRNDVRRRVSGAGDKEDNYTKKWRVTITVAKLYTKRQVQKYENYWKK